MINLAFIGQQKTTFSPPKSGSMWQGNITSIYAHLGDGDEDFFGRSKTYLLRWDVEIAA
ncbi:methyltransferase LaeA [Aspergillus luchuensis]|uniref:Methyltransferase LaeA n=1 Tax=Aspergillus kawachii TaxID=1069201 RepID=A0A146FYS0_ASPKA|nr:methyltransferase LaeA [Aspergillus luchuensis]